MSLLDMIASVDEAILARPHTCVKGIIPILLGSQKETGLMESILDFMHTAFLFVFAGDINGIIGIFLYSTFITSLWIWLYVLGALFVRGLNAAGALKGRLGQVINLEDKPLSAMGSTLIALSTAIYLIWAAWMAVA